MESRSCAALLSELSRSSVGVLRQGIREIKEITILIKRTFFISEFFGSSLVLISPKGSNDYSFFGSSLVFSPRQIGKELGDGILIKVLFALSAGGVTLWCGVA